MRESTPSPAAPAPAGKVHFPKSLALAWGPRGEPAEGSDLSPAGWEGRAKVTGHSEGYSAWWKFPGLTSAPSSAQVPGPLPQKVFGLYPSSEELRPRAGRVLIRLQTPSLHRVH